MKTCEEVIDNELAKSIASIREVWEANKIPEEDREWDHVPLHEYIVHHAWETDDSGRFTHYQWALSFGGPSDHLEFHVSPELVLTTIIYRYKHWYDGAFRAVEGEDFILLNDIWTNYLKGYAEAAITKRT